MPETALWCAGRWLTDPADRVRRYCGLDWSGGAAETWAFRYFDLVPTRDPDWVEPIDVLACAALHPGLSRDELSYFDRGSGAFDEWLAHLPADVDLADADPELVARVAGLLFLSGPVGLSLLSKVAHHKRPRLVPMLDRAILERYRATTGMRGEPAWPGLVAAMQQDLADERTRPLVTETAAEIQGRTLSSAPSPLRVLDIAIWMEALR